MNQAEKLSKIITDMKTSWYNWLLYFFLLRKYRNAAKNGYTSTREYKYLNPWLINKLSSQGFKLKEKDKKKKEPYILVTWMDKEKEEEKKQKETKKEIKEIFK